MFDNPIEVKIQGGLQVELPPMYRVKQVFKHEKLESIPSAMRSQLDRPQIRARIKEGDRVAVAVGSRGIANLFEIVCSVVEELKRYGARPFIIPAMGSHGGATAEGQLKILKSFGITEQSVGAEIVSSMDVVELGQTESGLSVYLDKNAAEADAIVVINRVKPHTDFKAEYESGICKMMAIGLGKHKGATTLHAQGFDQFGRIIPEIGSYVLEHAKLAFGVAVLENAYDETWKIEALAPGEIMEREKQLLDAAKQAMPKLLAPAIDVLIVDEIGKDISGSGMDPNITGRASSGLPGFQAPPIQKIVILNLTEKTEGNACGIGLGDVTTRRLVSQIDLAYLYANTITATVLDAAKIPLTMNNDQEAIGVALKTCNRVHLPEAKIMRIKNTLELDEILISESLYEEMKDHPQIELLEGPIPVSFDEQGFLVVK